MSDTVILLTYTGLALCALVGVIALPSALWVLLSTLQLGLSRWYRRWYRNRVHIRSERAYRAFAARYPKR